MGTMETSLVRVSSALEAAPSSAGGRVLASWLAGRNEHTERAYRADLRDFASFVLDVPRETVSDGDLSEAAARLFSAGHGGANALALDYRSHLVGRKLSAASVNAKLRSLRSLVKRANVLGAVPWKLEVDGLEAAPYRDTRGPGPEAVRTMLAALEARGDAKGVRDYALVRLAYDLGLRRVELARLDRSDVEAAEGVPSAIWILGKKRTAKERLSLPRPTSEALRRWLGVRGDAPARGDRPDALFVTLDAASKGSALSPWSVWSAVRSAGALVGIRVWTHGLRHSAITAALDATGGNLRTVAKFSRHRDLRVLEVYDDARRDMAGEVAALVAGKVSNV